MTIIDVARQARARGMTYGQYMAAGMAPEPPPEPVIKPEPQKPEVIAPRYCGYCGKELPPGAPADKKYCSPECLREAMRIYEWEKRHGKSMPKERVCQNCGKPIDNSVSYRVRYCSGMCRYTYNNKKLLPGKRGAV